MKIYIHIAKLQKGIFNVIFRYNYSELDVWIPIEYRRTGLNIDNEQDLYKYLNDVY